MNRRDFIRSLSAACVAALVPWKPKAQSANVHELAGRELAKGGPIPAGFAWGGLEGDEVTIPATEWNTPQGPVALTHDSIHTRSEIPQSLSEVDLRALYDYWKTSRHIPG